MPAQMRVGDIAKVSADAHGCPACPHTAQGPFSLGSPDVYTNGQPTVRKTDIGDHMPCCALMKFTATAGSGTVFVNSLAAVRTDDATTHCGGSGTCQAGSGNVTTGG